MIEILVPPDVTKRELIDLYAAHFEFPAHYKYNWDSFWDCLNDFPREILGRGIKIIHPQWTIEKILEFEEYYKMVMDWGQNNSRVYISFTS